MSKKIKITATRDLSEEMERRIGVSSIHVEPYDKVKITVDNNQVFTFDGPAVILVNMD